MAPQPGWVGRLSHHVEVISAFSGVSMAGVSFPSLYVLCAFMLERPGWSVQHAIHLEFLAALRDYLAKNYPE